MCGKSDLNVLVYMLRAVDGFAPSVDHVALLSDRAFASPATDRSGRPVVGGANGYTLHC